MKKWIFVMLLVIAICCAACGENASTNGAGTTGGAGAPTGTVGSTLDLWAGVAGDSQQFPVELWEREMTLTIYRDGTMKIDSRQSEYMTAESLGYAGLEAEMAGFLTYYGSYRAEKDQLLLSCEAQDYRRLDVRGKDAEALKKAYSESNLGAGYEDIFDKGVVANTVPGTMQIVVSFRDDALMMAKLSQFDEAGNLQTLLEVRADGATVETSYYENGAVELIWECAPDGTTVKRTAYLQDGTLSYVEEITNEDGWSVTTRTDGSGNVIRQEKYCREEQEGFERTTNIVVEQGVETYVSIIESHDDGIENSYYKTVNGNEVVLNISISRDGGYNPLYSYYHRTVDGQTVEYSCFRQFYDIEPGDLRVERVELIADMDCYRITREYYDPINGRWEEYEVAASAFEHFDWETPVWPEG